MGARYLCQAISSRSNYGGPGVARVVLNLGTRATDRVQPGIFLLP
jgi:hypothetical protein